MQPAQVPHVAVHAAVGDEPEQVQGRAAGAPAGVDEHRVCEERARLEVVVDAHQVLAHDPARRPRLVWPTSELPICPSGRPTARPEASSCVCG